MGGGILRAVANESSISDKFLIRLCLEKFGISDIKDLRQCSPQAG